jgi:serine/threonine-protein kinase
MPITDALVLPDDVLIVPVAELPAHVRDQVACEEGEFAVTRPRARTPSRIIDAQAAALLEEFRRPQTIVAAVIRYSRAREIDPEKTLEDAFPMLQGFVQSQVLLPADSQRAGKIEATLEAGGRILGFEVLRCLQVLEDTELYQVRRQDGQEAALKIVRPGFGDLRRAYGREAAILKHLDGVAAPRLLEEGEFEGRPYLAIEWCTGVDAMAAANDRRHRPGLEGRRESLRLARAVLEAYDLLHERGVIHGDVHPRNVIVADDGSLRIVDFGLARLRGHSGSAGKPHRGGVGFFFEPEYAKARLGGHRPPLASQAGEQYALATLVYLLLTGVHYLDFSLEKEKMYRQIAADPPLPFVRRGLRPWPEVESLLARALSKDPADRFASVAEFAAKLGEVILPEEVAPPRLVGSPSTAGRAPAEALLDGVLRRLGPDGPLLAQGLGSAPLCSVNNGAAGIAYALYRIACARGDAALLSLADVWATTAARDLASDRAFFSTELEITPKIVGPVSPYHTASGVSLVQALIGQAMGDVVSQQSGLDSFLAASAAPCENLDLTLGRSGSLLACSMLLDAIPEGPMVMLQPLREFGRDLARGLWEELDGQKPIRDVPKMAFLGIAHGWAGALYATMRWCRSSGEALPSSVEGRLRQLAELAEPDGRGARWKRKLRKRGRREQPYDYVPSWCNGTAGFVHLWTLAHATCRDPAYLDLAEKAAWNTYEDPTFLGDLCCGLAGRAYALLSLYKSTGEASWLTRAREFADRAALTIASSTIREDSLYKGSVGVAVLAADLAQPEGSCMPLFEAEGWPAR